MQLTPVTFKEARAFVAKHHRHSLPPVGHKFSVGISSGGNLVGVAVASRPVARQLAEGDTPTLEVTRVCVTGAHKNACSMLYGACKRAAKALGYQRLVTYTLDSEPGSSPAASGFIRDAEGIGGKRWQDTTRRTQGVMFDTEAPLQGTEKRTRWVADL